MRRARSCAPGTVQGNAMSSHSSVQRRLITPQAWGKKDGITGPKTPQQRSCSHCGHKGLVEENTIAGNMCRCPACKKLQF